MNKSYLTLPSLEFSRGGTPIQELPQDEFSFPTATHEIPWHAEDAMLPATQFAMSSLLRLNQRGFGITSLDLRHTCLLGYDEYSPLNITPGMGVHFWSGPQTLDLPPQVYDVYMDLQWQRHANSRWFFPAMDRTRMRFSLGKLVRHCQ